MNEDFLHYIWKFRLFSQEALATTAGEPLQILHPGRHNTHAGPDFLDARIKIGNTIWAGNVEIHIKASDWLQHRHQFDKSYDNVVLHVVYDADMEIEQNAATLPALELKERIGPQKYGRYLSLMKSAGGIPCENQIGEVDELVLQAWQDRLLAERLEEKTAPIEAALKQNSFDWETTFYHFLAKNFGLKINAEPFYLLAKSLPIQLLAKHKNNFLQIEALLFGQAGFLEEDPDSYRDEEAYPKQMQKEYQFLQKKYRLKPLEKYLWKFLRLRPPNFPTVRIAQFAALVHNSSHLFSKILEAENAEAIVELFKASPSEYWNTHYNFDKQSQKRSKNLGASAIYLLIINAIVPFLFIYGKQKGNEQYKERALQFLEQLPSEKNSIISKWESLNIKAASAYQSQALLQLKNHYCDKKQCLNCAVGNAILKRE